MILITGSLEYIFLESRYDGYTTYFYKSGSFCVILLSLALQEQFIPTYRGIYSL